MTSMDARPHDEAREQRRNVSAREALADAAMECGDRFSTSLRSTMDPAALRAAVRDYARRVREQRVPPERAVAAFKAMLFTLPALRLRIPEERVILMADLTRMSIEEYYAD